MSNPLFARVCDQLTGSKVFITILYNASAIQWACAGEVNMASSMHGSFFIYFILRLMCVSTFTSNCAYGI